MTTVAMMVGAVVAMLFTLTLGCSDVPASRMYYVGVSGSVPAGGFGHGGPSGDGTYLGLSSSRNGPFAPLGSASLMETVAYGFTIVGVGNPGDGVYFSTAAGGGGPGAPAPISPGSPNVTVSGGTHAAGNGHVGAVGDCLRVVLPLAFTPTTFYYQSTGTTGSGYALQATPCVSSPPGAVELLSPAAGASNVPVGTPLVWQPVDGFGVACPGDPELPGGVLGAEGPRYKVLFAIGSGPISPADNVTAVPPQGQQIVDPSSSRYELSSASVEPGRTYSWMIIASNGKAASVSSSWSFTTAAVVIPTNGTVLSNGVVIQDRIFPDVPASFSKYKYYSLDVASPGGTLLIVATASPWNVVSAPAQGAVNLFATPFNTSFPEQTIRRPTASQFVFRSEEDVGSTDRRSIQIPVASSGQYFIGVEASGGSATYGLTAVYTCPLTSVQDSSSGTSCSACPANMEALVPGYVGGVSEGCRCQAGFFGPVGGPCARCPVGGVCDGGVEPSATVGWWAPEDDRSFFFSCPVASACLGGPDSRCRAGYEGRLCSICSKDYYKLNGQCYRCRNPGTTFFFGIVILILFLVLCVELARWYRKVSSVVVTVNFLQTVAVLPLYQLQWPQYVKVFFNDLSGFNLNPELTAPECSFPVSWKSLWVFTMFFPVIVGALMSVVYGVVYIMRVYQVAKSVERPIKTSRAWDVIVPTYVTFILFFYVSIAKTTVQFFDCTEQADDTYTLDASADILCYSSEWFTLLPLAVLGFLVYVIGVPVYMLSWLFLRRHRLYELSPKGEKVYRWLGPLYLRFHVGVWGFESVIFARKLLLVVIGAFLTSFTLFQSLLAIAVLVVGLWIHLLVYPYAYSRSNWLEALYYVALIVLLLMGVLFQSNTLPNDDGMAQFVFGVFLVLFIICLAAAVYCVVLELRDVYRYVREEDLLEMQVQLLKRANARKKKKTGMDHVVAGEAGRVERVGYDEGGDEVVREAPTMVGDDFSSDF